MKEFFLYPVFSFLDRLYPASRRGVPVLLYHGVNDRTERLSVATKSFEEQMAVLKKSGYKAIGADKVLEPDPAKRVAIVFDDGFKDVVENALPIMENYGFKGTVFVSTDFIGGTSDFVKPGTPKFRVMDDKDLVRLADTGWMIASHFASHRDLVDLKDGEIKEEYRRSIARLKEVLGERAVTDTVSYPHNRTDKRVKTILGSLGVKVAFAGGDIHISKTGDPLAAPRISMAGWFPLIKFRLLLSPSFSRLKSLFSRV